MTARNVHVDLSVRTGHRVLVYVGILPGQVTLCKKYMKMTIQSNLSYLGALGLGGARNSDLSVSHNINT